ncbi:hypothetical protein ACWCQN_45010, partial [Streptomyces sp. NPDC001984]
MGVFPHLVAARIFLMGGYGLATSLNLIDAVGCLSVCQSSTYVLLLAIGYRDGATAPVQSDLRPGGTMLAVPSALLAGALAIGRVPDLADGALHAVH